MTSQTPAVPARRRRSKDIGTDAERPVARYLAANGFPHAERRTQKGRLDQGDITGTPGVCWEVKVRSRPISDNQIVAWLKETETERVNARADVGVLVVRRPGFGEANAGSWWAVMTACDLFRLHGGSQVWGLLGAVYTAEIPVRMLLGDVVTLLRAAGYGEPLELEVSDGVH